MWIKIAIGITTLAAITAGTVPFIQTGDRDATDKSLMTYKVSRGDLNVTVTENGMLESSNNEEIKCMVKGGSTVLWVIETGTIVETGEELVRMDTSLIEDNITQQQITYERAIANDIIAQSEVDVAKTNIEEYLNGTYLEERSTIEKSIFDSEEMVKKKQLAFESSLRLASKGVYGSLQMESEQYAVDSARKDLELQKKKLDTLDRYKKKKTLQQLQSALNAAQARLAAEKASLKLAKDRLDRDKQQLTNCIITAPAEGMVIFPSAAEWKETPDIEEGARVREQQTLLMIPDTSKMQVKVGVHESKVGRLRIGMTAKVALQDLELTGKVDEIAEVTRPAGWWTGNMVKYDTMIRLDPQPGLKPGMSAVVDIVLASYTDVVKVPVAAIVQSTDGYLCWIRKDGQIERRNVTLGDTNDEYIIVQSGLAEGEEVVLNPLAHLKQAEKEALKPGNSSRARSTSPQKSPEKTADKVKTAKDKRDSAETPTKKSIDTESQTLLKAGDKNGDGFLQKDELAAKDQANFAKIDANKDNKISISELSTALKAAKGK
ncbi:efflux RND transporter periplasmic adaptor subunit [bacterium]|nr:efflux RND transporter periplasmic adaptor subunit [bacterium]MDA7873933.1 efflux RND transporter periplasmic adaptor subunit [Rhodopirellula sp.]MDA7893681.1 efflux RND transporter periplasmic adaptor subunit [bacterium]MDB4416448.1 efflux RND transporter periplasmic adaptor subunit [bacterium]MDB4423079.1 efflux RND transporter periplasmic adaptor subunit [Rhodopirellula sp.]